MRNLSVSKKIIYIIFIVGLLILIYWTYNNQDKRKFTEEDNIKIHKVVSEYYKYIEEGNYELAFSNLNWTSDAMIDTESKIRALHEINENIIEEFKVEKVNDDINFYDKYNSIAITTNYNIKYKGRVGYDTTEIVLVSELNGVWKIDSIVGLDRYGIYRAPYYECSRLVDRPDNGN